MGTARGLHFPLTSKVGGGLVGTEPLTGGSALTPGGSGQSSAVRRSGQLSVYQPCVAVWPSSARAAGAAPGRHRSLIGDPSDPGLAVGLS